MSTPGSVRSGEQSVYTPPAAPGPPAATSPRRTRVFRWEGIIPMLLAGALLSVGWTFFGEALIRDVVSEAGTKALGAQLDIADLEIHPLSSTLELRGVALADPFDRNRNLFEIREIRVVLDPRPLLERKIVVKSVGVADVATGTRRSRPATAVTGDGFAPRALAETRRFASQFNVPLLSLTPIDTLKSLVLDPTQLRSVQAALAVGREADSVKQAIETGYAALRVQETIDSSRALAARLQGTNVRALGVDGVRRAADDVRRASARVDSARRRVDALLVTARRGIDSLQAGVASIDAARRDDYAFARGLLKLPSFEGPDLGSALFGRVTIERFEKALYWSSLARQYAPPGLLPRESPGPKRLRRSGTTVHFVAAKTYPRFWVQRLDVNVKVSAGALSGGYVIAARDITTDPAIVGRPMVFAMRRVTADGDMDTLRVTGSLDHTTSRVRENITAHATGVRLPTIAIPSLPYEMYWGRGSSDLRIALDGGQLSGHWSVRSPDVRWALDSGGTRALNTMERVVARVLTGIHELDLSADISGTLERPRLLVKSNLDRQLSERLRSMAGEEISKAEAKARAQVDRMVDERSAPVRARVAEIRTQAETRVAEARSRLDEEKRRLDERLKALTGGLMGLPRLPGG